MLHPSYTDLIRIVNNESEGDTPVVNSRYSIVMAAAKRARQIVAGEANVSEKEALKPLSTAVKELAEGKITILPEDAPEEDEQDAAATLELETEDGESAADEEVLTGEEEGYALEEDDSIDENLDAADEAEVPGESENSEVNEELEV